MTDPPLTVPVFELDNLPPPQNKKKEKKNHTDCAEIILNAGINWTCKAIEMIAWLSRDDHSESVSCRLTLSYTRSFRGKKNTEHKTARNIRSSTYNSLITTREQPRRSANSICICFLWHVGWKNTLPSMLFSSWAFSQSDPALWEARGYWNELIFTSFYFNIYLGKNHAGFSFSLALKPPHFPPFQPPHYW